MRVIFEGTLAELAAYGLLDLESAPVPPRLVLINLRLHSDPYNGIHRLRADVLDSDRKEVP
ncbi:hypothetical protein ACFY19_15760 [Streptosporangium saharense]|uniref:hypothetical protein n=1 Tax=Streptosporangium saharense TaxID=1706840 RepID=UPI0036B269A4